MISSHTLRRAIHICLGAVCLSAFYCLTGPAAFAQVSLSLAPTDGTTQSGLAPGTPAGSYALSGFESINPYTGGLNFRLPLLQVGGRGDVSAPVMLQIEQKWSVTHDIFDPNTHSPYAFTYNIVHNYSANPNWWSHELRPEYSPGVMIGRLSGSYFRPRLHACGQRPDTAFSDTLTRLTFIGADGTEFELRDAISGGEPKQITDPCVTQGFNRGRTFITADGSGATFISDQDIYDSTEGSFTLYPTGYLRLKDGTQYRIESGRVTEIRDRNGNRISYAFSYGPPNSLVITDSLNRVVTVTHGTSGFRYDDISWKGADGNQRSIRVYWANLSQTLRAGETQKRFNELFPLLDQHFTFFEASVPSQVLLPDGRSYYFKYNSYGELARVELPTGGVIEYDWGPGLNTADPGGVVQVQRSNGLAYPDGAPEYDIIRRVRERRLYVSNGVLESRTVYGFPKTTFSTTPVTDVTVESFNASGQRIEKSKHYYLGYPAGGDLAPINYSAWYEGREVRTEQFALDGETILQSVDRTWQQRASVGWYQSGPYQGGTVGAGPEPPNDPRLVEMTTTLADANMVSRQTFGYDQYNNQTDVYAYDFGTGAPGPLIRRTHTDFVTLNNGVDYAADTNIHIRDLPLQAQVFDAGGTKRAETIYEYDNYNPNAFHAALGDCPNISGHDGAFSTGYLTRGNLTKTSRSLLSNNGAVTGSISSYAQYDIAGNAVKAIDASGNPTTLDFSDRFGSPGDDAQQNTPPAELNGQTAYAFATKVTNALNHTAYTKYDYYLGKPVTSQDPNGIVSSLAYDDALDRPTQGIQARYKVTTPACAPPSVCVPAEKRQTTITYDDANHVITTTGDRDTFGDNIHTGKSYYDGLGRTWRGAAYEGSTNWTITDTQFDALGRVSQVSNPYRAADPGSASPPAGLWTTTEYDALGRVVKVTTPDAAHIDTAYSGNQVTVTDQAGKKRRSVTDALGRLVLVLEDPGGLNYQTSYLYDVLGNLRKVTQGAQKRWFTYDSLSRLIRAKNPEQADNSNLSYTDPFTNDGNGWSMAYSYDANGNLVSKTDARNITTTYGYDALNRNTTVTYSDSTPGITRTYDTATLGKGRLQKTETAGSMGSRVTINAYDAMGRPLSQSQQFFYLGAWGTSYTTQQTYNLAGNVKALTYPSGHTVNYSHDQAGRLSGASGNLGGSPSTYADTISYNAAGQMIKERFGTNTSLYHNSHYNNRLQLVDNRLGDSPTDEWNRNRGAISFLYGTTAVANGDVFANDTDNNGNLRQQINYVPLASGGNVIPQQHDYTYDALNRIATIRERQRNENGQWADSVSQTYNYDRSGNRALDLSGGGGGQEMIWADDSLPAGAVGYNGGEDWNWLGYIGYSPAPYSGSASHQSNVAAGVHQHLFQGATQTLQVGAGERLYAYVYLDPANTPSEVMLQWCSNESGWVRAYWGANNILWGNDGTAERKHMGSLPAAGGWVRLEVPASALELEGKTLHGMAFTLYGGRANWDQSGRANNAGDTAWVEDSLPVGAVGYDGGDSWIWVSGPSPSPYSGAVSHQSGVASGIHQHLFQGATQTLQVGAGERLYAYVYLDPANTPSEVMLQWCSNESGWVRAYWGANNIPWGNDGTTERKHMGSLPAAGGWVRLEVPASALELEGKTLHGMAFTLYGGRASWDKAGKVGPLFGAGPPINNSVYTVDAGSNRLTAVNGFTMSYDPAGNQTNDGSGPRTYDAENRMLTATNGGVSSSYAYDADGRRVRRIIGGQEAWQIYGIGGELLEEYAAGAASSAPQKEYGYRGGQLLVMWDVGETGDRQLQWLVQDHLGSTRMVVDRSGSLAGIRRHDFAPFGEELVAGIRSANNGYSGDSVRQKFGSKERDNETGLDYFLARYYSSVQGRFTSPDEFRGGPGEVFILGSGSPTKQALPYADIFNPQSLNKYQFTYNNPLRYVDPDGHDADDVDPDPQDQGGKRLNVQEQGVVKTAGAAAGCLGNPICIIISLLADPPKVGGDLDDPNSGRGPTVREAAKDEATAMAMGIILPKGIRATSGLFSGVRNKVASEIGQIIGKQVVLTDHAVGRFITRVFTEGAELSGVTIKQVGQTLKNGTFFFDNKNKSYVALGKSGEAIAFIVQKGKILIKTIEKGTNVVEGDRFKAVDRPF